MNKPLDEKALSVGEFANSYEWESEDGSYTPNGFEIEMIEDAIEGYISQATQAGETEAVPVAWRARHSQQENWYLHHGSVSWWECQPLYAAPPIVAEVMAANEELGAALAAAQADNERLLKALDAAIAAAHLAKGSCGDIVYDEYDPGPTYNDLMMIALAGQEKQG